MKTAAVIAEYNPFHKGHEYLLRRIRKDSGADFIVVMMSGDFVQRGEPAVIDKYGRTRAALLGGADLVLELPAAAALGSAGDFAETAVRILDRLGVVDELWFGSETGDPDRLFPAAEVIALEPEPYGAVLRSALAEGLSYPAAQSRAALAVLRGSGRENRDAAGVPSAPNDLLATAYLASLIRAGSRIVPRSLKREGGDYHAVSGDHNASDGDDHAAGGAQAAWSAESIRMDLADGRFYRAAQALPEASAALITEEEDRNRLLFPDDFGDEVLYTIRRKSAEQLTAFAGVSPDLANRMKKLCFSCHSFSSFAEALKTKNVTRTRINRALFSALLGIRKGDAARSARTEAVRILGFRTGAERLIGAAAGRGGVLPVTGAKDMPRWYETDVFASNLCEAARAKKSGLPFHHEFAQNVVKL
jgi:predicted nucleotidyltransferase